MKYEYITDNNLYNKQIYMYSSYEGILFIKKYLNSRTEYLEQQKSTKEGVLKNVKKNGSPTQQRLRMLLYKLKDGGCDQETIDVVNDYAKSFEVRKRIYTDYDNSWKPLGNAEFEEYECYLLFADCLISIYDQTNCLKYFSCLLKIDDTMLSVQDKLDDLDKEYLKKIIMQELKIFNHLADNKGICLEV